MRCDAAGEAGEAGEADGRQRILPIRRDYNRWVADQTLEDYALRFTAKSARRWSVFRVANTAIGGISFLALEAIGGAITLTYGFTNAVAAILVVALVIFITGLPISLYAARYGVDIDLLTRGAGFGYLGSTVTSLIYASFTFIFFALEAAIMAKALQLGFGLPEWLGFIVSSLVVIPLVTYGFTFLSRFQLWTQPLWIVLHVTPFVTITLFDTGTVEAWTGHTGRLGPLDGSFDLALFGAASGVVFSLVAQIGEQVDFLRFLPVRRPGRELAWWTALISTGPGWIVLGALKLLAGSFLAFLAFKNGVAPPDAAEPTHMYQVAFGYLMADPRAALIVAVIFVVLSQLKINVTNAYAGSIAWSNFFSRLTHSHPGRVVWVVFNVAIALMLMELGIYKSLEHTLGLYSHVAVAWVGALFADLVIDKPLGLSPAGIEFKRAHLYDINPVGFGGMLIASAVSIAAHAGLFGTTAAALSCFIGLGVAVTATPLIAWASGGRYYLARRNSELARRNSETITTGRFACRVCEHTFEAEDMAHCPAYAGPICSLCCTLDARCNDRCKVRSRLSEQLLDILAKVLPSRAAARLNSSLAHYFALLVGVTILAGGILAAVYFQSIGENQPPEALLGGALAKIFLVFLLIAGVVSWLFVLAHESRRVAQEESDRQTGLLMQEIAAHEETDRALQAAKEVAEAANLAKSRYLAGISHEFRTPLNAILGYAQLIDHDALPPANRTNAVRTIRRSGEHLASLVEGLLDIARIEAGRLTPERNVFSFPEFIEQIVATFRLQAETQGIAFRWDGPARLPAFVRADEKRLRQILLNLLSNAVKFTQRGEVSFSLRFRNEVGEFLIQDTGIGIAEADLERIFMPFERIENPSGPWLPGTGLGLTITKLMIEVMGGEIVVTSRVGEGSRFVVRLHLPSAVPPTEGARVGLSITGYLGERVTVLVVDDQPSHRRLVEDLLRPLGFEVIAVPDGASCLEVAARVHPELVLLDISMPGMNGWEVARRLREHLMLTGAIIMVSADAAEQPSADLEPCDHDDYVVKPIDLADLLTKIGRACDLTWTHAGADASPSGMRAPLTGADARPPAPVRVAPSARSDLETLAGLARIGYVRALACKIEEIAAQTTIPSDLLDRLSALAATVDLDAFLATVETALDELAAPEDLA
ncbi:MAG: ATP-binding protein [Hyphomicrobiales bacterium]|nr:ATP-binding protein [Hyphomicrobiales bacterium]